MEEQSIVDSSEDRFPDDVIEDVDGLLWLGYLDSVIEFCGHEFVIRTLRLEEEMLAGLLTKEYSESMAETKAFVTAQVAMALVSVDGDEDFCPPAGPNKKDYARARFNYVASNWYEPTVAFIYTKYAELLDKQASVIKEMDFLSRSDLGSFLASPSSLIAKADSQTTEEILDLLDDPAV
jgi:hypothetical protein